MTPSPEPSRRLAAVWFADIVGYTTLSQNDEDGAILVVEAFQRLAQEIVPQYQGRVVKYIGDAALAEFASTDGAIRSALALVERFIEDPAAKSRGMLIRVGVNVGEVISAPDGDIYGDGVNMASRLQNQAEPGQVVASETVHAQIRQRPVFKTEALGEKSVKGVANPVRIFAVSMTDPTVDGVAGAPAPPRAAPKPAQSSPALGAKKPLNKLAWIVPLVLVAIAVPAVMMLGGGAVAVERATYPVIEGGLEVAGPITLEFTGALDRATVTSQNIRLVDARGAVVPAEVSLGTDETSVTIKPSGSLAYASTYTLTLSEALTGGGGAVRGPDGGGPGASITIETQAIPAGAVGPRLAAADGFDANAVPSEGPIRLEFSEAIDPATATAGGVRLAAPDGSVVEAAVIFADGNREVRLEPTRPLPAGGRYTVLVDPTLMGVSGLAAVRDSLALRIGARRGAGAQPAAQPAGQPGAPPATTTSGGGAPGTLSVTVVPAAAQPFVKVVIDGDTVGPAPLRGHPMADGRSHSIILVGVPELSSFALPVFRQTVTLRPGEAMNLAAEISSFGSIDVVSQPGGTVFIDGRQVGRTPLAGYPVLAGIVHRLEIRPSPADQARFGPFTTEFRVGALEWKSLGRLVLPAIGQ